MIRLKMHWQLMNGPDGRKHLNLQGNDAHPLVPRRKTSMV
jgi:hypothetical protein